MDNDSFDMIIKIAVYGDASVGKTNIINRYLYEEFDESMPPTIGVDFLHEDKQVDGKEIQIQFWDTAGQEKYSSITKNYYQIADGIILVFDLSNRESFQNISKRIKEIRESSQEDTVILLVGNKKDLQQERKVSQQEAMDASHEFNLHYMETSAKENSDKNIENAMDYII